MFRSLSRGVCTLSDVVDAKDPAIGYLGSCRMMSIPGVMAYLPTRSDLRSLACST